MSTILNPRQRAFARPRRALCGLFAALALLRIAHAEGGPSSFRTPPSPVYRQECGACHLAYPPGLLPGAAWQRLMKNLPQHFGTDASLDAAVSQQISGWLTRHAGADSRRSGAAPPERITTTPWFRRQHDEVAATVWPSPAVTSAANCGACHTRAAQGDFDEHQVRIPR